ncbi:FHA domain-containing protein, partial (plasmid) [Mycolicibacterium frederiksbergense]
MQCDLGGDVTVQQCQEPPAEVGLPTLAIEVAGKSFTAAPEQGPVLIGRALPAQIRITAHAISRTHLRIEPIGQQWVLSDAGTRNGTFLDGERIDSVPLPVPLTEAITV